MTYETTASFYANKDREQTIVRNDRHFGETNAMVSIGLLHKYGEKPNFGSRPIPASPTRQNAPDLLF